MNTLLHVLEGYTGLYEAAQEEDVKKSLFWILDLFAAHVYQKELGRQEVFFDKNWNSLIDLYSYGHDIETSWLLDHTVEVLGIALTKPNLRRSHGRWQKIFIHGLMKIIPCEMNAKEGK